MTSEQVKRIGSFHQFDPQKYEQHGLGLALVKLLVARHEARFTIESSSENGSTITVGLSSQCAPAENRRDTHAGHAFQVHL